MINTFECKIQKYTNKNAELYFYKYNIKIQLKEGYQHDV